MNHDLTTEKPVAPHDHKPEQSNAVAPPPDPENGLPIPDNDAQ